MRGTIIGGLAVLALLGVGAVARAYVRTSSADHDRVRGRSSIAVTPTARIEYSRGGAGPPVLVVHGAGGGFDQGELLVEAVLGDDFNWIAPSRFGYLRSTVPDGATAEDQAHAFARLLDQLGIDRVAVVALSAGGPSALHFALLHPQRVSSLTLVSCGAVAVRQPEQAAADRKGKMLVMLVKHDLVYWAVTNVFETRFFELMGIDRATAAGLTREQRDWARRFVSAMRPVTLRHAGAVFDNTMVLPDERIAGIRAPTLIVHAEDDRLQLFDNSAFAAGTIPGARLLRFDHGGHLVAIVEQATVREAIRGHVLAWFEAGIPEAGGNTSPAGAVSGHDTTGGRLP